MYDAPGDAKLFECLRPQLSSKYVWLWLWFYYIGIKCNDFFTFNFTTKEDQHSTWLHSRYLCLSYTERIITFFATLLLYCLCEHILCWFHGSIENMCWKNKTYSLYIFSMDTSKNIWVQNKEVSGWSQQPTNR